MSRTERYRKRCGDEGNLTVDETNPLPKLIDPITLEPVVTPAISPFGHVMGLATWKVGFDGFRILACQICHTISLSLLPVHMESWSLAPMGRQYTSLWLDFARPIGMT